MYIIFYDFYNIASFFVYFKRIYKLTEKDTWRDLIRRYLFI